MTDTIIAWRGEFLEARQKGRWEWAARTGDIHAAVILAVDDEDHVILVEQPRVPLGRRSIELPAGLVGDEHQGEAVETAAARELEEETGYRAGSVERLGTFASSPGMTSETFTLVRATGLTRVGEGGGEEAEDITVHRVPLADVPGFIEAKRREGMAIDAKVLLLLGPTVLGGASRQTQGS